MYMITQTRRDGTYMITQTKAAVPIPDAALRLLRSHKLDDADACLPRGECKRLQFLQRCKGVVHYPDCLLVPALRPVDPRQLEGGRGGGLEAAYARWGGCRHCCCQYVNKVRVHGGSH